MPGPDPYEYYESLRAEGPVAWTPQGVWVATGHAEATSILRDKRFSNRNLMFGSTAIDPATVAAMLEGMAPLIAGISVFMDPPEHTRLRSLANRAFTPKAVAELEPEISVLAHRLVDAVADQGHMDLVSDFATPLSLGVIGGLLGVPEQDHHLFQRYIGQIARMGDNDPSPDGMAEALTGFVESRAYVAALVKRRQEVLGDDLFSAIVAAIDDDSPTGVPTEDVVGFGVTLLLAGHDTTSASIASAAFLVLSHPDVLSELRADPARCDEAAEEAIRIEAPVPLCVAPRLALEDVDVGGVTIEKGQSVRVCVAAANRDAQVFYHPSEFDIHREDLRHRHLAFAVGPHACLGATLARAETRIALQVLLDRLPGLALAGEPEWVAESGVRKLSSLPVTF